MNTAVFVLILFAHVGPMGDGNSNALTVAEFTAQDRCMAAGKAAAEMALGTVKNINWVCVPK
jgi:hypothetical protein